MTSPSTDADRAHKQSSRATQLTVAGVFLVLSGVVSVVQGVIALVNQSFFTASGQAVYHFDPTVWGWAQLLGGIIVVVIGVAVLRRTPWARPAAVVVAALNMFASFVWFPWHVFGSMLLIAINGFVMGAVLAPGVFMRDE